MTTDDEIKAAESAARTAREALSQMEAKLEALHQRRAFEKHGTKLGARVRGERNGKKIEGEICKVDANWQDKPWVTVNPIKKDGTVGNNEINLFSSWELV